MMSFNTIAPNTGSSPEAPTPASIEASTQVSKQVSKQDENHCSIAYDDPLHPAWNDSVSLDAGIFGLPFAVGESSLVIIPAPWDMACSQRTGTAEAPRLVAEQSHYVELHDIALGNIYQRKIALTPQATEFADLINDVNPPERKASNACVSADLLGAKVNEIIHRDVAHYLAKGKSVALLGGDHSVSFGSIKAHHEVFPDLGVLQIDAHADLRASLDGMKWSHASVMYHVMQQVQPQSLVQVGIRATCSVETQYASGDERITQFTDHELQARLAAGIHWINICDSIIQALPAEVYLTLDIDGLDPSFCPNTGTPVPGGLSFPQLSLLLHRLVDSGRVLRGFDLVEVGGHETDALNAAHLLYLLCGLVEKR